jgi:hypothetical protein
VSEEVDGRAGCGGRAGRRGAVSSRRSPPRSTAVLTEWSWVLRAVVGCARADATENSTRNSPKGGPVFSARANSGLGLSSRLT